MTKLFDSWEKKPLGDVCEKIASGGTPSRKHEEFFGGSIPWVVIKDIKPLITQTSECLTKEGLENSSAKLWKKGTVILSTGATIGKVGIAGVDLCTKQGITGLVPKKFLYNKFLAFYLETITDELRRRSAGVTIREIYKNELVKIKVPIPSLPVQKQISLVLSKVNSLKEKRRNSIQQSKKLIFSVLDKKFGSAKSNPKNWKLFSLSDVCKIIHRYPTFYGFEYGSNEVPVVKIGNIDDGFLDSDLSNYDYIPKNLSAKFPKTILALYDTVLAVVGDGSAGKVGLAFSKNLQGAITTANLLRISADDRKIDPIFLYYLLASTGGQDLISAIIQRTAKKHITTRDLKNLKFPIPPLKLQSEFTQLAIKLKKILDKSLESDKRIQILSNALFNKIFKGEIIN